MLTASRVVWLPLPSNICTVYHPTNVRAHGPVNGDAASARSFRQHAHVIGPLADGSVEAPATRLRKLRHLRRRHHEVVEPRRRVEAVTDPQANLPGHPASLDIPPPVCEVDR